jgi:NADH:ubiquinone oxidoreductase subunit F (NADH-binding)
VPLDFDTLAPYGCFIGSAAIVVLSNQDHAAAAARNVMRFSPMNRAGNAPHAVSARRKRCS